MKVLFFHRLMNIRGARTWPTTNYKEYVIDAWEGYNGVYAISYVK